MKIFIISQKVSIFLLLFILCATMISCAPVPSLSISPTPTPIPPIPSSPTISLSNSTPGNVSGSYITNTSIAEMVSHSTLIVMAHVVKADHIINMARDVGDPSQPAKDVYGVGQVYQIRIDIFIKGNEAETIFLVQPEGFLGPTESKNNAEILKSKSRYNFIPMNPEKEYLMFLRPMLSYPEEKLYVGNAHPWRFDISDPGKVVPESPWTFAINYFPPQPLDVFLEQIAHPEKITPIPSPAYPPPQSSSLSQTAYPALQKSKP
jgi:hypothetical protein